MLHVYTAVGPHGTRMLCERLNIYIYKTRKCYSIGREKASSTEAVLSRVQYSFEPGTVQFLSRVRYSFEPGTVQF